LNNKDKINENKRKKYYQKNKTSILVKAVSQINENAKQKKINNYSSNSLNTEIRNKIQIKKENNFVELKIINKGKIIKIVFST
jgi:hypothetical protein